MSDFYVSLGANAQLHLQAYEASYDVPTNTSSVQANVWLERTAGTGRYSSYTDNNWSDNIDGQGVSGSGTYDLRGGGSQLLMSNAFTIVHNSDGTRYISVSAYFNDPHANIGTGTASGTLVLTTIPRASTPTFSANPIDAGTTVTITTNRADATFTHDITYSIGATSGTINTGVGASTTWAIPITLLTQFPNSTSGAVTITTVTKNSGGTAIGTTTVTLNVTAPSTAVPSFTTITNSEATTTPVNIATTVGAYVQSLTTLALAITGAAGYQGSTISSYSIAVAGQTINASSGTTAAITTSGTVAIVGTVTDSRGRTASQTVNITVLAYGQPTITSATVARSDSSGVLNDNGTYIRMDLNAAVQSLIVSTQKNTLTYNIFIRARGAGSWGTVAKTVTLGTGTITFNSYDYVGTYAIGSSWEVLIQVVDKFNTVSVQSTISTAAIFMHWYTGLGVGKYWERGQVDAFGQMYENNGNLVPDMSSTFLASDAETIAGTLTTKLVTPHGLGASRGELSGTVTAVASTLGQFSVLLDSNQSTSGTVSATPWISDVSLTIGSKVQLLANFYSGVPSYSIIAVKSKFMQQIPLTLSNNWTLYSDSPTADTTGQYGDWYTNSGNVFITGQNAGKLYATITSTGIVTVEGMVNYGGTPAAGAIIATLPVGMRPTRTQQFLVHCASTTLGVVCVDTSGNIRWLGGTTTGFMALNSIRFRASGYQTFVPLSLTASFTTYTTPLFTGDPSAYTPGYTLDSDGVAIFEGIVKTAGAVAINTDIARATALFTYTGTSHTPAFGQSGQFVLRYGGSSGAATSTAGNGNYVNIGTAITGAAAVSLANLMALDPASSTTPTLLVTGMNSWTAYGSGWRVPCISRTPDGLVIGGGLWNGGTAGTNLTAVGAGWRPRYESIWGGLSSGATARVDIGQTGGVLALNAAWQTLDGLSWPAYR